jgi:uncharacterized protein (DUF1499 family)
MKKVFISLLIGLLLVTVGATVILFTSLGDRPLAALFSVGPIEPIDFENLRPADKPNQFIMCPAKACSVKQHADSPIFDTPADRLRQRWDEVLAIQPRIKHLPEDKVAQQFNYIQRTARFRFPDLITVRFFAVSPLQSTLAIYSRSVYGKSDFGANRQRIEAWVELLKKNPA